MQCQIVDTLSQYSKNQIKNTFSKTQQINLIDSPRNQLADHNDRDSQNQGSEFE